MRMEKRERGSSSVRSSPVWMRVTDRLSFEPMAAQHNPHPMLLAVDVGNTQTHFGAFEGD